MKVLIAPDKFKGSLTAAEVVHHLGSGLEQRGIHYDGLPLADGGDGSVAAAVAAGFRSVEVDVAAATGERHSAAIAFDGATAVVEVANTCGLHTLPARHARPRCGPRRPGSATPSAPHCSSSAKRIVLALGGSASTDGGTGMLAVLGAVFRDEAGQAGRRPTAAPSERIHTVDLAGVPDLSTTEIVIASDVQNPLTGPGRSRRRLRAAEGGRPGPGRRPRRRTDPPRRPPGRLRTPDGTTARRHRRRGRRRWARVRRPAAGRARGLRRRLLPRPAAVRGPPRRLRPRHHRRGTDRRPDPARQAPGGRRPPRPPDPGHRGRRPQRPHRHRPARHGSRARCTPSPTGPTRNPADDPALSARLLEDLGRTMPLPARPTETP